MADEDFGKDFDGTPLMVEKHYSRHLDLLHEHPSEGSEEAGATEQVLWEPNRQVVYRKFPSRGYFPKPKKFTKRFYHELVDLEPCKWEDSGSFALFGDFCTARYDVRIFHQASLDFVKDAYSNEFAENVNEDIKKKFRVEVTHAVLKILADYVRDVNFITNLDNYQRMISSEVVRIFKANDVEAEVTCILTLSFRVISVDREDGRIPSDFMYKRIYDLINRADFAFREHVTTQRAKDDERIKQIKLEAANSLTETQNAAKLREQGLVTSFSKDQFSENESRRNIKLDTERAEARFAEQMGEIMLDRELLGERMESKREAERRLLESESMKAEIEDIDLEVDLREKRLGLLETQIREMELRNDLNILEPKLKQQVDLLDIEKEELKRKAERVVDREMRSDLLAKLPELLEVLVREPQKIDQLRVVSFDSPRDDSGVRSHPMVDSLTNPFTQIVQGVLALKEVLRTLNEES